MKKTIFVLLLALFLLLAVIFLLKFFIPLLSFFNSKPNYNASDEAMLSNKKSVIVGDVVNKVTNKPIIGVHFRMIDKQSAIQNNLVEGAYITQVIQNSPAEKAKLLEEDIITEIDSRAIADLNQQSVYDLISTLKPGSQVSLKIWRNKEIKTILITLD